MQHFFKTLSESGGFFAFLKFYSKIYSICGCFVRFSLPSV
ncbi:hypothetical protein CU035_1356 [Enterococcus faecium]|nr:hypothetical protein HMPREF9522_02039 [Enterococcus faecium TX0082]EJX40726.1 hypothetical protein HMPREF1381_01925 [Enterococcus faecium R501]EJY13796.1 hypothetical protein HMPREF1358_02654 [Enterococcus faecium C621]EJY49182.1 hypothetical protein HMPREF1349_00512 [Enterococcus faecium 506]EPI19616.1 hypothetical protein D352_02733 [Enterococcus faecium LA4B-2]MBK4755623.1 hypothetical protein [Enterococcus faecium]MBL4993020.1 hypothetical protein [Enterococcus lactis]